MEQSILPPETSLPKKHWMILNKIKSLLYKVFIAFPFRVFKYTLDYFLHLPLPTKIAWSLIALILLTGLGFGGYTGIKKLTPKKEQGQVLAAVEEKDIRLKFLLEIYDKIQENYWDKITDEQLSELFRLAAVKLQNKPFTLLSKNKAGVEGLFREATVGLDEAQKKQLTVDWGVVVLSNLQPFGRSGLFTSKQEQQLANTVQNVNPEKNLYTDLGLEKGATTEAVKIAYEKEARELRRQSSPEAKAKLEQVEYANTVLSDEQSKQAYDSSGAEPTVFSKTFGPNILHLYIKRFSPTTLDEFVRAADKADKIASLDTLIFDMRGNIGGAIDIAPYFLGPFIGFNQYAYELWHQGKGEPVKTTTDWLPTLVRYKKVVVLIDQNSQSTAELMAGTLKKYNVGLVAGTKSKGWGTIERIFELENQIDPQNEKYSMFLVHTLTLRDDNQPIEGRGVEPYANLDAPGWEQEFMSRYNDRELVRVVEQIWKSKLP